MEINRKKQYEKEIKALKKEVKEFVECNVKVERWEEEDEEGAPTGNKETGMYLFNPNGKKKYYYNFLTNPDPAQEKSAIKEGMTWLELSLVQERLVIGKKVETIYEECPEMLCGENPCSCCKEPDHPNDDERCKYEK